MLISLLLITLNSIRYLIFGITEYYNDILIRFIQYIIINNRLLKTYNFVWEIITNIITITFYGFVPHRTDKRILEYLERMYESQLFLLIENNKFITSVISFLLVISLGYCIFKIYNFIKRSKEYNNLNQTNKEPKKYSYYLNKMLLLSYCNVTTLTFGAIIDFNNNSSTNTKIKNIILVFVILIIIITYIIGFPLKIYKNKNKQTQKYVSIYNDYKSKKKFFINFIFLKQILISILTNINNNLTNVQNTLFLLVNCIFFVLLLKYRPYKRKYNNIKTIILTLGLIIITILNYVLINLDTNIYFDICYYLFHLLIFMIFIRLTYLDYQDKKKYKNIVIEL